MPSSSCAWIIQYIFVDKAIVRLTGVQGLRQESVADWRRTQPNVQVITSLWDIVVVRAKPYITAPIRFEVGNEGDCNVTNSVNFYSSRATFLT